MKNSFLFCALLVAQIAIAQSATEAMAWMKIGNRTDLSEAWSLTSSGQYRTGTSNDLWLPEYEFIKSGTKNRDAGTGMRHYLTYTTACCT